MPIFPDCAHGVPALIAPCLANDPTGQRASRFLPASRWSAWLIDYAPQ